VRVLAKRARQAREAATSLEKVVRELPEPSSALKSELTRLQAEAKEWDNAKPQEVREREMRGRFRTMQSKLEANVKRKSLLEAEVRDLEARLAKQMAALATLETTCMEHDKKVREMHAALGATSSTPGSDGDDEDVPSGHTSDMEGGVTQAAARAGEWWGERGRPLSQPPSRQPNEQQSRCYRAPAAPRSPLARQPGRR
jgi:uncharacterized coiled-coil protein SlyX